MKSKNYLKKKENATQTQGEQNPGAVCAPPGDAAGLKGSGRGTGAAPPPPAEGQVPPPPPAPISTEGRGGWLSDGSE